MLKQNEDELGFKEMGCRKYRLNVSVRDIGKLFKIGL